MNENDPIVLSFEDSLLRVSDIQLLQGPHWLNDQIISFYFEFLEKRKYKEYSNMLFVSPEVTQCLKITPDSDLNIFLSPLNAENREFIFFAFNDNHSHRAGGSHWNLLVFSRNEQSFFYFDSSGSSNLVYCQDFANKIRKLLRSPNAKVHPLRCLQQSNSYDCGIHVLCTTDQVVDYAIKHGCVKGVTPLHSNIIDQKREELLQIIRSLGGRW